MAKTTKITHQTTGLTTYLTKEGQARMYGDGKATKMYETKNLQDSDLTTTNPIMLTMKLSGEL